MLNSALKSKKWSKIIFFLHTLWLQQIMEERKSTKAFLIKSIKLSPNLTINPEGKIQCMTFYWRIKFKIRNFQTKWKYYSKSRKIEKVSSKYFPSFWTLTCSKQSNHHNWNLRENEAVKIINTNQSKRYPKLKVMNLRIICQKQIQTESN